MDREVKDVLISLGILFFIFVLGICLGRITKPAPEIETEKLFTKGYLLSRYPKAGEDSHLYVIDFQFDNVEEVIDWINKYESVRER